MKRALVLVYAVIAYCVFLASFLYLALFPSGFLIPKGINDGQVGSPGEALLINVFLIALFALQHTIMARSAFKKRLARILPPAAERSTFVLLASLLLFALCWFWEPMPQQLWQVDSEIGKTLLYLLSALGIGIVLYSSFIIDHFDLFGLRQAYTYFRAETYRHPPLQVTSLYRYVRHPLMLGLLIWLWCTPSMTLGNLVFATLLTVYIRLGVWVEEKNLSHELGEQYHEYARETPALIPKLRPGKKIVAQP